MKFPSEKQATPLPLSQYWPRHYTVIGLCCLSSFVCYLDRVNISVAIIPMASEFGWDKTTSGIILSSFFYGYIATQILGGWLADRFGGKAVIGFGVLWWSALTLFTPPATAAGITFLFTARLLLGLGEGVNFPAILSMYGRWVPARKKSRATALTYAGIPMGTVAALIITPWIIADLGWRWVFYLYGGLGFLWWLIWQWRITDLPAGHPSISEEEVRQIRGDEPPIEKAQSIPWRIIFSKGPVWALIINHFCANWGFYLLLAWLPTYFNDALGVDLRSVGWYSFPPYVAMFVMGIAAGGIADRMIERGWSVTNTRKLMQSIGLFGPAIAFALVGQVETPLAGVAIITLALALGAFALAGFGVNHLDIAPRYAGTLLGITNTAGTIPGIIAVATTGMIVQTTGSWASAFLLAACIYVIGGVVWLLFSTGDRVLD